MLSLAVEVQGSVDGYGEVKATCIPAEPFILKAAERDKKKLFPIWAAVGVSPAEDSLFASQPVRHPISFPVYRVYISNTSDRPVKAYLWVNLTN